MPAFVTDPSALQAELERDLFETEERLRRLRAAVPVSAEAAVRRAGLIRRTQQSLVDLRLLLEKAS